MQRKLLSCAVVADDWITSVVMRDTTLCTNEGTLTLSTAAKVLQELP